MHVCEKYIVIDTSILNVLVKMYNLTIMQQWSIHHIKVALKTAIL